MLASKRARQLCKGAKPAIDSDNREVVVALREIADGKVKKVARPTLITAMRLQALTDILTRY